MFGTGLYPSARNWQTELDLADYADSVGLDFISIQDHPYNPTFLDTWTLLSVIGARTQRVRLLTDVLNLPLRPPAMLAKAAATLDILTGGRVELGIGAGAFWEGVVGYGGPKREPSGAVDALAEAIQVMQALWQQPGQGQSVFFPGTYYTLEGAQPGPVPAHPIRIWVGALKPRLLRLTGRLAGGLIISSPYVPPEEVNALNVYIDEGAMQAGREPSEVRRGYNIAGAILTEGGMSLRPNRPGVLIGPASTWVRELTRYYHDLRLDTFNFSPTGDDTRTQVRIFAEEVVPAVREALGS